MDTTNLDNLDLSKLGEVFFAQLAIMFVIVVVLALPLWIAIFRDVKRTAAILIIYMFFSWTIIGWFAALYWAIVGEKNT